MMSSVIVVLLFALLAWYAYAQIKPSSKEAYVAADFQPWQKRTARTRGIITFFIAAALYGIVARVAFFPESRKEELAIGFVIFASAVLTGIAEARRYLRSVR